MNEFQRRREARTVPPDASGARAYSIDGRVTRSIHDEELDAFRERSIFIASPRGGILTVGDLQARLAAETER